jgi:cytochrome c oxidase subunit 3
MSHATADYTKGEHAHHYNSAGEQFEAAKQGMWVFMVTEVLMLGAVFVGYLIFKSLYLEDFKAAHHQLSVAQGGLNTVVLLLSSLTMVLGVTATQRDQIAKAIRYLWATFGLACVFLVVKYFEYSHKFHIGIFPGGLMKNPEMLKLEHGPTFFSFYFVMTGIHGLHVVIGMGLIYWMIRKLKKRQMNSLYFTPVEMVGFYWHFVDLVWIYLFPLLYLVG